MKQPELKVLGDAWDFSHGYPRKAMRTALAQPEEAIPECHAILQYTLSEASSVATKKGACLHIAAAYLLALFRDRKGLEWLIPLLCIPGEVSEQLFGDVITEDLRSILASMSHGDPEAVLPLIIHPAADPYARLAAVDSLVISTHIGELPRDRLVTILRQLLLGELIAPDGSCLWSALPGCIEQIHPEGLVDALEEAVRRGHLPVKEYDRERIRVLMAKPVQQVMDAVMASESFRLIGKNDVDGLQNWLGGATPGPAMLSPESRQRLPDIDRLIAEGEKAANKDQPIAACHAWLKAWDEIKLVMEEEAISSLEVLSEMHPWKMHLAAYSQELEMELGNAALVDASFHQKRIAYCTELLEVGGLRDRITVGNARSAIAEAHFALGETETCDALYEEWLAAEPGWTLGYILWADCWTGPFSTVKDWEKAERILQRGLSLDNLEARVDLLERLVEVYKALGDDARATACDEEYHERKRLQEKQQEEAFQKVMRLFAQEQGTQARKAPLIQSQPKKEYPPAVVHPNNFCPCGSGKKYKKCCMPAQTQGKDT